LITSDTLGIAALSGADGGYVAAIRLSSNVRPSM
jgi:hypothetical protein